LLFWALQVEFISRFRRYGGAHLGLQWNPRHPAARAVNWGGYDGSGRLLTGTSSTLPSTPHDPNTRDFRWEPAVDYRLRVSPGSATGSWTGSVTDLGTGRVQAVRDLYAGGDRLARPVVWSEIFADCDDPSVSVTWLHPSVRTGSGVWTPDAYRVSYQAESDGGCSNTDVVVAAGGVRQVTSTARTTPSGALVPVGGNVGQGGPEPGR